MDELRRPVGVELEKSLVSYARAAIAAGVSLLAATLSADAEVVYTPANTDIPVNNNGFVSVDLNHDGIADFAFWNFRSTYNDGRTFQTFLHLYAGCFPAGSTCLNAKNEVWGRQGTFSRFASALRGGFSVRPNAVYFQQAAKSKYDLVPSPVALLARMGDFYSYQGSPSFSVTYGQFFYTQNRYLGFQFEINGQLHYGWARVTVGASRAYANNTITATLTGYAYETIPGKPIVIQPPSVEPQTLGQLALGASGRK